MSAGSVSAAATAGTLFDAFGYLSDSGGQFSSNRESGQLGVDIVANGAPGVAGTVSLGALDSGGLASITAAGAVSIGSASQVQAAYIYAGGAITLGGPLATSGGLDLEALYAPGDITTQSLTSEAEMSLVAPQMAEGWGLHLVVDHRASRGD